MRRFALLLVAAAFTAACAPRDTEQAGDTMQAMGSVAPMISYADVAGTWDVSVTGAMTGDSVLTTFVLVATPDSTGWTVTFPGRDPLPLHVMPPTADSIVAHLGPYESALRPGVMTTTTFAGRLVGGKLESGFTARYTTTGPDSLLVGRAVGTKR